MIRPRNTLSIKDKIPEEISTEKIRSTSYCTAPIHHQTTENGLQIQDKPGHTSMIVKPFYHKTAKLSGYNNTNARAGQSSEGQSCVPQSNNEHWVNQDLKPVASSIQSTLCNTASNISPANELRLRGASLLNSNLANSSCYRQYAETQGVFKSLAKPPPQTPGAKDFVTATDYASGVRQMREIAQKSGVPCTPLLGGGDRAPGNSRMNQEMRIMRDRTNEAAVKQDTSTVATMAKHVFPYGNFCNLLGRNSEQNSNFSVPRNLDVKEELEDRGIAESPFLHFTTTGQSERDPASMAIYSTATSVHLNPCSTSENVPGKASHMSKAGMMVNSDSACNSDRAVNPSGTASDLEGPPFKHVATELESKNPIAG